MPLRCLRRLRRQVEHQTSTPEELAELMPSPSWSIVEEPRLAVHGQRARTEPLGTPSMGRPFQCSLPFFPEEANQGRVCSQSSRYSSTSGGRQRGVLAGRGDRGVFLRPGGGG